jgi:hypothetical protein
MEAGWDHREIWVGLIRRGCLAACASAFAWVVLAIFAIPAHALLFHRYESSITEIPAKGPHGETVSLPGPFAELNAMTVDSGHLWVSEHVPPARTDEFNAETGAFEAQLPNEGGDSPNGVAIGHSSGETQVYVAYRSSEVGVRGESGVFLGSWTGAETPNKSFGEADGIAVDNNPNGLTDPGAGDVYVTDGPNHVVNVFKPEAGGKEKYVTQLTGTGAGEQFHFPIAVAVDEANGDVLVGDSTELEHNVDRPFVDIFEPTALGYVFVRKITGTSSGLFGTGGGISLVVDADESYVYVGHEGAIDQFNLGGEYLGRVPGFDGSVAVDQTTHRLFVGESPKVDILGPTVVVPDPVTGAVSNVGLEQETHTWRVRLNGTVDPDNAGEATCHFVWGTSPSFGQEAPCTSSVPNGSVPVAVRANVSGLAPGMTYYYRLEAENAQGLNAGEESQNQHFTTAGPALKGQSASKVTDSSVRFGASIDPDGKTTSYRFEYDTRPYVQGEAPHGTSVPQAGAAIGSGNEEVEVEQPVQGLAPSTEYHYRIVATGELSEGGLEGGFEEFDGPDETFITQGSGGRLVLPDGREWELVSPPDKMGAVIQPITEQGLAQAATRGDAFTYLTIGPTEADPQGSDQKVQVLSSRCGSGWSSLDIAMPHSNPTGLSIGAGFEYRYFSEDLTSAIVEPFGPFSAPEVEHTYEAFPEATERTPYVRHNSLCQAQQAKPYEPLVSSAPEYEELPLGTKFGGNEQAELGEANFVGATPDADHVVIESKVPLTAGGCSLYEWNAREEQPSERLQPLYVLPEGEGGGIVCGSVPSSFDHQLSDDGSVFFGYEGHLYLQHVDKRKTLRLRFAPGALSEGEASFVYASSDGSGLLFRDSAQLTSAPGGGVYECRIAEVAGQLTCAELSLTGLSFEGIFLGGSEDASRLYFADPVADTLFVDRLEGSGWKQTAIATLSGEDERDWYSELDRRTSRVSPNGEWLAFMSDSSLTGYDNRDAASGIRDEEVFLYSAKSGKIVCASCNPTDARPSGVQYRSEMLVGGFGVWDTGRWLAANVPGWTPYTGARALYQSRYLSNEGRLFFNSSDALVPQDTNGNQDVYEYEPVGYQNAEGKVQCKPISSTFSERSGGCVGLISSGVAFGESAFLDASETGGDVFFLTAERLVRRDADSALDVYDAHECTVSSPCPPPEPASAPECVSAAACRAAPNPEPSIYGAPSSATFNGTGNIVLPPIVETHVGEPRSLTRAQQLTKALRACRKDRVKRKRVACERVARKRYGPAKSSKAGVKRGLRK